MQTRRNINEIFLLFDKKKKKKKNSDFEAPHYYAKSRSKIRTLTNLYFISLINYAM